MAKKIVQPVEVQASVKGDSSVKSFKAQIREAQQEALRLAAAFGETDARTLAAAQRVAELKDRMDDVNATIAGLHPDRFQMIANITGTMADGFAAAQGAAALLGSEGEDLQRAMVRVQGAMAFSQGIAGLKDLKFNLGGIGTIVTGTVIPALRTMQGAIVATGIVGLISGLAYWLYESAKATDELTAAEARNAEQQKKIEAQKTSDQKRGQVWQELQGKFIKQQMQLIQDQSIESELAGKSRLKILQDEAAAVKNLYDRLFVYYATQADEVERATSAEDIVKVQQHLKEINNQIRFEQKRINDEAAKKRKDELDKQKLHSLDILGDLNRARLHMNKILNDAMDKNAKHAEDVNARFKQNLVEMRTNLAAINDEFDRIDEEQKKAAEARNQLRIDAALTTVDLLDSIFANANAKTDEERRKEFERRKVFEVASTMISTFAAAQQAYASQIAILTPDAPVRAQVAAAIAIAQGLARVVAIKKQQFGATPGGGGMPSGGGGGMQRPSLPSTASALPGGGQMAGQQQRVFVTESDISATQGRVKALKAGSVI